MDLESKKLFRHLHGAICNKLYDVTRDLLDQLFRSKDYPVFFSKFFECATLEEIYYLALCIKDSSFGYSLIHMFEIIAILNNEKGLPIVIKLLDNDWQEYIPYIDRYRLVECGMERGEALSLERYYIKRRRRHSL